MGQKLTQLNLPAFAFVESGGHEKEDLLEGRTVIIHVRSASIVEIFDRSDVLLNNDVLRLKFTYTNRFGIKEELVAALHYTATLDPILETELIKKYLYPLHNGIATIALGKTRTSMEQKQNKPYQWAKNRDGYLVLIRTKHPRFVIEVQDEADNRQLADALRKAAEFVTKGQQLKPEIP